MLFETEAGTRVRFAPSPTGFLHIGGARTAIFNWLFARHHGGKFLLRIEDTDFARSSREMADAIIDGLSWLGIDWDEEPVYQSQRLALYQKACDQLLGEGRAYYCFCSQERLEKIRQEKGKERSAYFYDGKCRNLSAQEVNHLLQKNKHPVVRFKVQSGKTLFNDEIRGSLTFDHKEIDDFVIMRSDNIPTYHLAVVVDDHEMKISHIIRGDDHLTNTPKQVLLYQALGWQVPRFAHVPLILGSDKKRLSKRHDATSVSEYRQAGYLPEAMFNFLALLGWSSGDNQEILTKQELIERFSLQNISKNSAIFDKAKLMWMNSQYISQMSDDDLYQRIKPLIQNSEIDSANFNENYIKRSISLLKTRLKKLTDYLAYGQYFFKDPEQYDKKAVKKHWRGEDLSDRLSRTRDVISQLNEFTEQNIEAAIRNLADEMQISAAKLIHPVRVALTGFAVSPGLFELIEVLGKEVTVRRLNRAIEYLERS